jgi:hypothetical protein
LTARSLNLAQTASLPESPQRSLLGQAQEILKREDSRKNPAALAVAKSKPIEYFVIRIEVAVAEQVNQPVLDA